MNKPVICPLDGRYSKKMGSLGDYMSEASFVMARLRVEILWLEVLASLHLPDCAPLTLAEKNKLRSFSSPSEKELDIIYQIEQEGYRHIPATKHDVKAVEYYLRLSFENTSLKNRIPWIHFALTSEDVNSAAYAMLLSDGVEKVLLPKLENLCKKLTQLSRKEARSVFLARTHGQQAVPTTFGKEIRVFVSRLEKQIQWLKKVEISFKFGGAVGNYNAHYAAFPKVDWPLVSGKLLKELNKGRKIKLYLSAVSTQVDNRDSYAFLFDALKRINTVLLDFSRDMWQYISFGLVTQKIAAAEVGSSTMPQKVNPIDFENAEGNLQLAISLSDFFAQKLPVSRLQRDLSDSTVLRNMPMAFGYSMAAYTSLESGLDKIAFNRKEALAQVQEHPEVLAEAVQTILRAEQISDAYEKLRDFSRGKKMTWPLWQEYIETLSVNTRVKNKLKNLLPENYVGIAERLARRGK